MEETKVTVTREEFVELIGNEIIEITKDKDSLTIVLSGGIVVGILCDKLFSESDTVSITQKEYCELTSKAIGEFAKDEKNKEIATPVSLLAIMITGQIKLKLFSEERLEKERMLQVAKMLVGDKEEDNE